MDEDNVLNADTKAPVEQKMLTQAEVDAIVGREKAEAAARARRELEATHQADIEKLRSQSSQNMGGMQQSQIDTEAIKNQIKSEFMQDMQAKEAQYRQEQREEEMQRVAATYFSKLSSGKEIYDDFDEIVGDFKHTAFPHLVHAVSGMDNTAAIMYELNKNPDKLERIDFWLNKDPQKGVEMLNKLSQSINQVRQAESEYEPIQPPLSQVKPSNMGVDNSGKLGLEEAKQLWRF
jgi:hypothetical protein